jgi:hypothetical protein
MQLNITLLQELKEKRGGVHHLTCVPLIQFKPQDSSLPHSILVERLLQAMGAREGTREFSVWYEYNSRCKTS